MSDSDSHRAEVQLVLEALLNKDRTTDVYGRNEKVIMEDGNLDSQSPLIDEIMALLDAERERWIGEVKAEINKLYEPSISDLELDEHHNFNKPVVYRSAVSKVLEGLK